MNPDRARRVSRKYALDLKLARLAQAGAERERATLDAHAARLVAARDRLAALPGSVAGNVIAAGGEWQARLDAAAAGLQPAREQARVASVQAARGSARAKIRVERVEIMAGAAAEADEKRAAGWRVLRKPDGGADR